MKRKNMKKKKRKIDKEKKILKLIDNMHKLLDELKESTDPVRFAAEQRYRKLLKDNKEFANDQLRKIKAKQKS
jgi:hypothetical protein